MKVEEIASNGSALNLAETEKYAAIIGECPSKGARSPLLWNAAFRALNISAKMWPMDATEGTLPELMQSLKADPRFIGGAVAVPFKQNIAKYLDGVEEEAQVIGAVNALYREGDRLIGSNTDGLGALQALNLKFPTLTLTGKSICLIGTGGAGSAVATYFAKAIGKEGKLVLVNRVKAKAEILSEKLAIYCKVFVEEQVTSRLLSESDILIQCTQVGMDLLRTDEAGTQYFQPFSPLAKLPPPLLLKTANKKSFTLAQQEAILKNTESTIRVLENTTLSCVYDIVYQPIKTQLLQISEWMGISTLNGEAMNLLQAVSAFHKANRDKAPDEALIAKWMKAAIL